VVVGDGVVVAAGVVVSAGVVVEVWVVVIKGHASQPVVGIIVLLSYW